jgi:hypothetical protein
MSYDFSKGAGGGYITTPTYKVPALESLTTGASDLMSDISKGLSFDSIGKAADGFLSGVTNFVGGLFKTGGINKEKNNKISNFVSNINNRGVAFRHLFYIQVESKLDSKMTSIIPLFCAGTSLPSTNILSSGYREYGAQYDIPYGISNDQLTMTFYSDKNMNIKKFFDMWQSMIYNKNTNKLNFSDSYRWNVKVAILDKELTEDMYYVTFKRAYPKTISNIELDYSNVGLITFTVTFEYESLEVNSVTADKLAKDIVASGKAVLPSAPKRSFPMDIIDKAAGVAGEFMNKGVGAGITSVKNIFGSSGSATDAATTNIRSEVGSGFTFI